MWLLHRLDPAWAVGLVAARNDDHFFMQGSAPLTLPVRSVDMGACHGVPSVDDRPVLAPDLPRYRWFTAASRLLAGGLDGEW
jgi:hypothetical protein